MENKVPNIEKKLIGVKEIFNLTNEDTSVLKETIEKNKGHIRVFIHPLFPLISPYTTTDYKPKIGFKNQSELYFKRLLRVLQSENAKNIPIFIFEEKQNLDIVKSGFSEDEEIINTIKSNLILVPTKEGHAIPEILLTKNNIKEQWEYIKDFLKLLGVKSVTLGGANLSIENSGNKNYPVLQQCVAQFYYALKDDFDIKFSNITHPNTKSDIKEAGLDLSLCICGSGKKDNECHGK